MKPKQILTDLMLLEGQLNNFSFEELTMEEAAHLKKSFMFFKNRLEEKVHGVKSAENTQVLDIGKIAIQKAPDSVTDHPIAIKDESLLLKLHDEFRAPINEILGFSDLIMEGTLNQAQWPQMQAISKITNNLSGILNELQEYIALATGKERLEKIDFNLSRTIKDTLFLCNALIVHKEVHLSIDIDRKVPQFLIGDPSKLSQILLYLLGNIIKYVNKGAIHLRIDLKEDSGDICSLEFQIAHQGTGKSKIDMAQFYNSLAHSESRELEKYSNKGFGHFIIKQLIENLNGTISVTNAIGKDRVLSFNLPYKRGTGVKPDNNDSSISGKSHLGKIWQECSGEIDLLEEMIGLFKSNILEFIGKLKIYLQMGEFEKIQIAAQKVRTNICLMQADSLLPIIDALLINCRTVRDIDYLNMRYDQFLSAYPILEQGIDTELKRLKTQGRL